MKDGQLRGALLTVFLTSMLCGPLIVFCPVLVKDTLQGNSSNFSAAISAFGVGGLVGAIALLNVDPKRDRRWLSSRSAVCYGFTLVLAALDPWLWGLPPLLALAGVSMSISNTSANSLLQTLAPPQLRGQTISLYMLAMRGGVSIGSLFTGASANFLGVRYALLANGTSAIITQLAIGRQWLRLPPREFRLVAGT